MATKLSTKSDKNFICETTHWEVYLNPDQYYLGRLVVLAKRDLGSMADLTPEEWLDFAKLSKKIETSFKKAFGATMFNWACLMNNAYQEKNPKPHVHWHLWPRYSKPVVIQGIKFEDKEFGHHYVPMTNNPLPPEIENLLIVKTKKALEDL